MTHQSNERNRLKDGIFLKPVGRSTNIFFLPEGLHVTSSAIPFCFLFLSFFLLFFRLHPETRLIKWLEMGTKTIGCLDDAQYKYHPKDRAVRWKIKFWARCELWATQPLIGVTLVKHDAMKQECGASQRHKWTSRWSDHLPLMSGLGRLWEVVADGKIH